VPHASILDELATALDTETAWSVYERAEIRAIAQRLSTILDAGTVMSWTIV